ncbi:biliverdin-producing heme oxygenase [Azospirillum sp. B4]|uniref:biliverdin-producing heme oxygenase n=1 Tax=Azospirillum sp. B4 TaxID=95605 RepID=UPI000344A972|nr:biliverdin-producing heme oxygenase [Azospirillum sp. B4]
MTGLREELRAGTAACHAALDQRFSSLDVGRMPDYALLLQAQHPALRAVELSLEAAGVADLLPDWPQRRRRQALEADMAALDARPPTTLVETPVIRTRAEMLGHLYVLEGSRLGAEVLLRRALRSDDPRISGATRFLAHGRGAPFWRDFVALLNREPADGDARAAALEAAALSFSLFQRAAAQVLDHYGASHATRRVSRS